MFSDNGSSHIAEVHQRREENYAVFSSNKNKRRGHLLLDDDNLQVLETCLQAGADPNEKDDYAGTPLDYSIRSHKIKTSLLLLKYGATPTPDTLDLLFCYGHCLDLDLLMALRSHPIKAEGKNEKGDSYLKLAIKKSTDNSVELIITLQLLVEWGADVNALNAQGQSTLEYVFCSKNKKYLHLPIVEFYLSHGVDLSYQNARGTNIVHWVIENAAYVDRESFTKILALILEHGADVNVADKDKNTPLHTLCSSRINDDLKIECLQLLLEHGADVNVADKDKNTPLHTLCSSRINDNLRIECLHLLLSHGAHLNALNSRYETPLHLLFKADTPVPPLFYDKCVEHGADLSLKNMHHRTAWQELEYQLKKYEQELTPKEKKDWEVEREDWQLSLDYLRSLSLGEPSTETSSTETPQLLSTEEKSLSPTVPTPSLSLDKKPKIEGWTKLHEQVEDGKETALNTLFKENYDLNAQNSFGMTLLMLLVQENKEEAISRLLKHPIDINKTNNYHRTALMMACMEGNKKVVHQLLDAGANLDIQDQNGLTAAQLAQKFAELEIVAILNSKE